MDGRRGQSETLGFALILGFTLISVGAIASFGGASLDVTQQNIGAQNAENAMSQFDSRASMVALGDSDNQQVSLGVGQQGTYSVDGAAGWIRVVHENVTANTTTTVYNESLGVVTYRGETTEIGYQGGGVWRQDPGGSVMLSPPEFRYRGSTLTLPVVRMQGDETVTGDSRLTVTDPGTDIAVYPNETRKNPVESGIVTVTVHSEYYEAWGRFFETRSDGKVTVFDGNKTASIQLVAPAIDGDFDMPLDGNDMTLQGLQAHQIDSFELTLFDDNEDNADFSNLDWALCTESGNQEFAIRVTNNGNPTHDDPASTAIYYSPNGTTYHTWYTDTFVFEMENSVDEDWNDDGDKEDIRLVLDLTSTANATYQDEPKATKKCDFSTDTFQSNPTLDGHDIPKEPVSYATNDEEQIKFIINHYLALLGPTVDLTVNDANNANPNSAAGSVSEELSTGYIDYNASSGYFLTYMHISENPVNVSVG